MSDGRNPPYPYGFNLPPTQFAAGGAAPMFPGVTSFNQVPTSFNQPGGTTSFNQVPSGTTSFGQVPTSFYPTLPNPSAPNYFPGAAPPVGQTTTNYYPQGGETQFVNTTVTQTHVSYPQSQSHWVPWKKGDSIPPNAVKAGFDVDRSDVYVGRLRYRNDLLPAKVVPSKRVAYISYDGKELSFDQCELLCHPRPAWVASGNGQIPANANRVGQTSNGETLYVGRVHHNGSLCVGKVHPSHQCCYIPFGGKEIPHKTYEVLLN